MRAPLRAVQAAPAIACGLAGRGALQHLGQRLAELRQEYGALCTHPPLVLERKQVPGLQQAFGNGHGMYTGQVPVARACLAQRRHAARRSSGAGWRAVGNPQDTFQHVRDLGGRQPMVAMAALRDGDQQIAFDQATQMRARRLRRHPGHTCQFHRGVGAAIHQLQQHRGACLVTDQGADTDKGTGGVDHAGIVACKARPTVRCRPKHHPPSPAHSGRPVSRENCCDPPFDPTPTHHTFGPVPGNASRVDDHAQSRWQQQHQPALFVLGAGQPGGAGPGNAGPGLSQPSAAQRVRVELPVPHPGCAGGSHRTRDRARPGARCQAGDGLCAYPRQIRAGRIQRRAVRSGGTCDHCRMPAAGGSHDDGNAAPKR
ncbi:hypothetical protein G6F68_010318 [Rhizopus microsporus]|nr:hypothetical protein G6F68_010318 [Rhizopus microsporus]